MKLPESLNLHVEGHLSLADAQRQHRSAEEILNRLSLLPGVVLGDEVGMGKTFVALAVASAYVMANPGRPVVVMVPPSVLVKWARDAETFRAACLHSEDERAQFRVATAASGVEFLKLLDDPLQTRASVIVLSHGALHRKLADKWVKLAVMQAAIRGRHGVAALRLRLARFAPMVLRHAHKVDEQAGLYLQLLESPSSDWKKILTEKQILTDLSDDPVPQVLLDVLAEIDLQPVFKRVVEVMPERDSKYIDSRIKAARAALDRSEDGVLHEIWRACLQRMQLKLPLLVLDEAHRVRNAGTQLASLLAATRDDLNVVRGQLAEQFERMLFLTATPFQLGHAELRNVLSRFEAIDWKSDNAPTMTREVFRQSLDNLHLTLDEMQLATDRLERCWKKILAPDVVEATEAYGDCWWQFAEQGNDQGCLSVLNERIRSTMLAFKAAKGAITLAEHALRPWVLRHTKSVFLPEPNGKVPRRERIEGAEVLRELGEEHSPGGIRVAASAALPFLLGARIITLSDAPRVFGESIASSYEALLDTRKEEASESEIDHTPAVHGSCAWYVARMREAAHGAAQAYRQHPKMRATIDLAMELWRQGEKVLIFCHYRETGAALHRHLSQAMLDEIEERASNQLGCDREAVAAELKRVADRLDRDRPAAREVVDALNKMIERYPMLTNEGLQSLIHEIVLRFLRTPTFLVRYTDLSVRDTTEKWGGSLLDGSVASGMSLAQVIDQFLNFLSCQSTPFNRMAYLKALLSLQTGTHAGPEVEASMTDDEKQAGGRVRLVANVRRVYGDTRDETRERLMLTFNTPFYPEVLIASSVMAEGVDLHLNCRHVIHHDLDWNPSSLEQRTGRIDRLGAKAERCGQPIRVYIPYVEGCQDEKLFRVVMDRERWFGVVMGAEQSMARVLKSSPWELEKMAEQPLVPEGMVQSLRMDLGLWLPAQIDQRMPHCKPPPLPGT